MARLKNKKPQGRPHKSENLPKAAKYMNWHAPFLWEEIAEAALHPSVGYTMSSSKIRDILAAKNPKLFGKIARTTIDGWIDRTGDRPRWSDAAMLMAEDGNHVKGGRGNYGVLVSSPSLKNKIIGLPFLKYRNLTRLLSRQSSRPW